MTKKCPFLRMIQTRGYKGWLRQQPSSMLKSLRWWKTHQLTGESQPMLIDNLLEDYAWTHFHFKKRHLQEPADKLWPRLSVYLDGTKHCIKCGDRYSFAYETLLIVVIYHFATPWGLRSDIEAFFGICKSKLLAGIKTTTVPLNKLAFKYTDNPKCFLPRIPHYAERVRNKIAIIHA